MIKPLVICFHSVILFIFGFFFGDTPNSVTGNFPRNVKPGSEFTADILVKKGNVGGFAKLQIEVPQGFTVKELDSKGATFSFDSGIAKYIWTSAPSDPEFTVKCTISVAASALGAKTVAAKYSFVNNNAKEVVEMTPAEIMVGEGSDVAIMENASTSAATPTETPATEAAPTTETVTPVATTNPTPIPSNAEPNSNVSCSRSIVAGPNANEYTVEVKIRRPGIKGFAKYQDLIPEGYTAKSGIQAAGSSFSVSDGKAKFVWVSLPAEDVMTVSYILEKTGSPAADARVEGEFSYLEENQTKKVKLPGTTISTGNTVVSNNPPTDTQVKTEPVQTTEPVKTETLAAVDNSAAQRTGNPPAVKNEGNVSYCVQIGAFRNAIGPEVLSKKFSISEAIKSELAEGYSKFMVGSFGEYKGARDHRENIRQKGCASAFVTAYNGPKRITVQEALMITNQKWFK